MWPNVTGANTIELYQICRYRVSLKKITISERDKIYKYEHTSIRSSPSAVTAAVSRAVKGDLDKEDYITSFYARAVRRDRARGGTEIARATPGGALVRPRKERPGRRPPI
ncbi:hypothetical protein EVAR_103197_1 [Eumeta japonica]|uniref:Uncharacterized protein n=1 Tax=Eumeta variegata TaxID=151549 RepID=A0A4C1YHC1_EUMVA|nr:hypothetical protein EVAR_103197_1 [Eumeta japonica]